LRGVTEVKEKDAIWEYGDDLILFPVEYCASCVATVAVCVATVTVCVATVVVCVDKTRVCVDRMGVCGFFVLSPTLSKGEGFIIAVR